MESGPRLAKDGGARGEFLKMEKITKSWLEKEGACSSARTWFEELFGEEALTENVLQALHTVDKLAWYAWLRRRLPVKETPSDFRDKSVLKHVYFSFSREVWGRAAVRLAFGHVTVKQVAGQAPPACLFIPMLDLALGEGWREAAEELHRSRVNPWKVESYVGKSKATTHCLRVLENAEFGSVKTPARLHVSMREKLNDGFTGWLGDIPPLIMADTTTFLTYGLQDYTLEEKEITVDANTFNYPGERSGFVKEE